MNKLDKGNYFCFGVLAGVTILVLLFILIRHNAIEPEFQEVRKHMTQQDQDFLDICLDKHLSVFDSDICIEIRKQVREANEVLKKRKKDVKELQTLPQVPSLQ